MQRFATSSRSSSPSNMKRSSKERALRSRFSCSVFGILIPSSDTKLYIPPALYLVRFRPARDFLHHTLGSDRAQKSLGNIAVGCALSSAAERSDVWAGGLARA